LAKEVGRTVFIVGKEESDKYLPPKVENQVLLAPDPKTLALMNELKKHYRVTLPSGRVFATDWATVVAGKLHQMCQGFFQHADGELELLDTVKLDWLEQELPTILESGPTLLWTNYINAANLVCAKLENMGVKYGLFTGQMSAEAKDAVVDDFMKGEFDTFVLTEKAAYAGLNLQRACNAVILCQDWTAKYRENLEARCRRIGSEVHQRILYTDVCIANSPDTRICKAIKEKRVITDALQEFLEEMHSAEKD